MAELRERMAGLAERAIDNNRWRQHRCFNLIPSEQTPSLLPKMFEICDPAGRYAEHRTQKKKEIYYYQGTEFIREVENECRAEMAAYFGCSEVELRPISGQMSNEVVFKAMLKYLGKRREGHPRMHRVVNNDLNKGLPPHKLVRMVLVGADKHDGPVRFNPCLNIFTSGSCLFDGKEDPFFGDRRNIDSNDLLELLQGPRRA